MAERKVKPPDFENYDLEGALRKALGNPPVGLETLKNVQVLQRAMMQQEALRLGRKLGADHPRVQRLNARLNQNLKLVRDMEVELEAARIRVPEVAGEEALVHGRVVSMGRRGHQGLSISFEDEEGKPLKSLGETKSDATGYYALPLDAEKLEAWSKVEGKVAYVTIRDPQGKLLHRESEPLKVVKGDRVFREVGLDRPRPTPAKKRPARKAKGPTAKRPTRKRTKKAKDDSWVVKGRVTDEEGNGVAGLMVRVVDKDRKYDDLLGAAQTDENGEFEISYRLQDFREGLEPGADLFVLVSDVKGKVVYSSEDAIRYDAGREEVFDITVKGGRRGATKKDA